MVSSSSPPPQPLLVPTFAKLSSFLATTCFLWLSEPLLALVDTTFVSWSQQGSDRLVVQLAAMGLATTYMDLLVYMMYFLAIATTTMIAELVALSNYRQLQISTSRLLGFAILCGSLVTAFTLLSARNWLLWLAGREYEDQAPDMVPLATAFVQIRALVAPLTVSGMVAHSFCLVTDHASTVAVAVLVSSATNVLLDVVLTPRYGMLGAACATACATSFSAAILLRRVCLQMRAWRVLEVKESTEDNATGGVCVVVIDQDNAAEHHSGSSDPDASSGSYDSDEESLINDMVNAVNDPQHQQRQQQRGLLSRFESFADGSGAKTTKSHALSTTNSNGSGGTSAAASTTAASYGYNKQPVPFLSLPDREALVQLLKLSLPLAFYMWAETASYASLTIAATEFGPVALAAQNVLMQVFHFLCCISESLAQAAQAFLPFTLYPRYHEPSFVEVLSRLCRVAAVVAVVGYQLSLMLLGGGGSGRLGLLQDTLDAPVAAQLRLAAPYLAACLCLHPFNAVIEGTVIATRDFSNIVKTYSVTLAVFGVLLKYHADNLPQVWRALFGWQLLRMFNYCCWRRRQPGTTVTTSTSSVEMSTSHGAKPDAAGMVVLPA
jgi:Na+-driven multidrug efflux pump